MNTNEYNILSMQFRCKYPLQRDLLQSHLLQKAATNDVYNTSNILVDETSRLEDVIYTTCRTYQKVIEEVRGQSGTVHLYITHHTQKARELAISHHLLRFLAEREISLGVD